MKKLSLYLLRWLLSTPILALVLSYTANDLGNVQSTILANLIGGLIFYNVDKYIFRKKNLNINNNN